MNDYDVAVVGGGPIGALAARHAAQVGARVLLVEQKDGSGTPANCTGLVSPRTLGVFEVSSDLVLREIKGGRLHLPGGGVIELRAPDTRALVIDRAGFDRELLKQAAAAGVEVRTRTRVTSALRGELILNGKERIKARVIVGADGPKSLVREWFGLPPPREFLVASQATVEGEPIFPDQVEVFVGREVVPGGFAWAVPAEEGILRVGLLGPQGTDTNALLARFLAARFPGKVHTRVGGLIPIGPAPRTYGEGVVIVGDAAGQVKPLSGGGLYPGGECGRIGGRIAGQAALAGMTDAESLRVYESRWRERIAAELSFGFSLRRVLFSLDDATMERIGAVFADRAILDLIGENGDLDYPSRLIPLFLEHRELWSRFIPLLSVLGGERVRKIASDIFST